MIVTTIRFSDKEHELLSNYAHSNERSLNNVVRELVRSLEEVKEKEPVHCEISFESDDPTSEC